MRKVFPLDHFGVVGSPTIRALLDQSTSIGKRKAAFRTMVKIAKEYKQLPRGAEVYNIGLSVNASGGTGLEFFYSGEQSVSPVTPEG